jgi:hypothetical protein
MTLDQLAALVVHHEERAIELSMVELRPHARSEVDVLRAEVTALRQALDASATRDMVKEFIHRLDCLIGETEAILNGANREVA